MRHIFIINPVAGKGKHVTGLTEQINTVCKEKGVDYEVYVTQSVGDATRFVAERAKSGESLRCYACGGDGTLGEVVKGAYPHDNVQVAVVPCGSGNDFVRSFEGVPFRDIAAQLAGDVRRIDLIQTGAGICVNLCSVGFDSAVALNMSRYKKIPLVTGSMAYILAIAQCFFHRISSPLTVTVDGRSLDSCEYVIGVCGNGKSYGGGFTAAPLADLEDGLLEIIFVKRLSRARFLALIGKYKKGLHLADKGFADVVTYVRAKELVVSAAQDVVVNYDGEAEVSRGMKAAVLPKALWFSLPLAHQRDHSKARALPLRAVRVRSLCEPSWLQYRIRHTKARRNYLKAKPPSGNASHC